MSKKNNTFARTWANQTELGKQFGLSAVAMGKKLKEMGLRGEDGKPTEQALAGEYALATPLKDGTPFFMWNRQKVAALLQEQGVRKLDPREVQARELADEWARIHADYEKSVYGVEEDLLYEEAQDVYKQAKRGGLIERVDEVLRSRRFTGQFLSEWGK